MSVRVSNVKPFLVRMLCFFILDTLVIRPVQFLLNLEFFCFIICSTCKMVFCFATRPVEIAGEVLFLHRDILQAFTQALGVPCISFNLYRKHSWLLGLNTVAIYSMRKEGGVVCVILGMACSSLLGFILPGNVFADSLCFRDLMRRTSNIICLPSPPQQFCIAILV